MAGRNAHWRGAGKGVDPAEKRVAEKHVLEMCSDLDFLLTRG